MGRDGYGAEENRGSMDISAASGLVQFCHASVKIRIGPRQLALPHETYLVIGGMGNLLADDLTASAMADCKALNAMLDQFLRLCDMVGLRGCPFGVVLGIQRLELTLGRECGIRRLFGSFQQGE